MIKGVKKFSKRIVTIILICAMMLSNVQFLYAENNDRVSTQSQIGISEEDDTKQEIKEEPEDEKEEEDLEATFSEIENEVIVQDEKEEIGEATTSELIEEKEEKGEQEEKENEEQEGKEEQEKASPSEIDEIKEEEIIVVEATISEVSKIKIDEQNVFAAPQEYILSPSWYDETAAGKAKSEITKIKISKSPEVAPTGSDASWNITGSNGLVAYIKGTEITIYAPNEGTIYMAEDSSYLFSGNNTSMYNKLTSIQNLNLLDTSRVKNMSSMFEAVFE